MPPPQHIVSRFTVCERDKLLPLGYGSQASSPNSPSASVTCIVKRYLAANAARHATVVEQLAQPDDLNVHALEELRKLVAAIGHVMIRRDLMLCPKERLGTHT